MKKQTAIETIIVELEGILKFINEHPEAGLGRLQSAYTTAISIAKSNLEKEKEQMIEAVSFGNRQDCYDATETLGEQYYNETYKKIKPQGV